MNTERFKKKLRKIRRRGEMYKKEKEIRDTYAEYWPDRQKKKVSNIMLVISVIAIIGYVIADYILQYKIGIELSPTITPYWFVFWTSEVFLLAGIKINKTKHGNSCDE